MLVSLILVACYINSVSHFSTIKDNMYTVTYADVIYWIYTKTKTKKQKRLQVCFMMTLN